MSKYSLDLDEHSAALLMRALDLYSRIGIGQIESVLDHPEVQQALLKVDHLEARYAASRLKEVVFGFAPGAGRSIASAQVMDGTKQAFDILCVLRHRLAWDKAGNPPQRTPSMIFVDYDRPAHFGPAPLPFFRQIVPEKSTTEKI